MASLLDLLSPYPILENLVSVLPLGDLLNLSKTDSRIRAALHGFRVPLTTSGQSKGKSRATTVIRPSLRVGEHETAYWRNLKARSPFLCSEPQHTRGDKIRGCLICSMPVCEACIIKASFGKRDENTFHSRTRSLCVDCYDTVKPRKMEPLIDSGRTASNVLLRRREWICLCSAKDGHLCLRCKTEQKHFDIDECFGEGCSEKKVGGFSSRVCLWCDLRLPGERSKAEARRDYDRRHLLARAHSRIERPSEDDLANDPIERQRWEEFDYLADVPIERQRREQFNHLANDPFERQRWEKLNYLADDPFERQRQEELNAVSQKRHLTAAAADDRRWSLAEECRRPDWKFYPPSPTKKQRGQLDASDAGRSLSKVFSDSDTREGPTPPLGKLTWHQLDSTASTLQEEADELPPTYDSVTDEASGEHCQMSSDFESQANRLSSFLHGF